MSNYTIFTDSACDIRPEVLAEWGVPFCSLTFHFEGSPKEYSNYELSSGEFYGRMRARGVARTAAVNMEVFRRAFEPLLQQGQDILYLGFSSGLSGTCQAGAMAAAELREQYPQRKILTVDTLAASGGEGLLLWLTLEEQRRGATLEQAAAFAEGMKLKICHWFTVDDLEYLKRGGRVSPTVALVGGLLGIRPVMHMDDEGHLIKMFTVRGRRASLQALVDKYGELAHEPGKTPIFISHGDCMEDAQLLARLLKEAHGVEVARIVDVGPVIGAHSGPGTLSLFFVGEHR